MDFRIRASSLRARAVGRQECYIKSTGNSETRVQPSNSPKPWQAENAGFIILMGENASDIRNQAAPTSNAGNGMHSRADGDIHACEDCTMEPEPPAHATAVDGAGNATSPVGAGGAQRFDSLVAYPEAVSEGPSPQTPEPIDDPLA